jgi:hypothetical protein
MLSGKAQDDARDAKAALSKLPIQIPFILAVLLVMNAKELVGLGRPKSLSFGPERTEE